MKEPTFLVALAIAGVTLIVIVRSIAGAFLRRGSRSELAELKEQVDEQSAELEEAQRSIADLHNRLDFAERLLAQTRERSPLGPGDKDK
jgi:cell division protein FtsL